MSAQVNQKQQPEQPLKHCHVCDKNEHNTPDLRLTPTRWGMLCAICLRSWQDYQDRNLPDRDTD